MQNFLSESSSSEIPFSGFRYTWRKKVSGPNNVYERLDKGVASVGWLSSFPSARVQHHIFTSSDHCRLSLDFLPVNTVKVPPFKFEKMCLRKDYDTLVKKTWCTRFNGSRMFCLVQKCKLLKKKSKEWNQTSFGNIFRQLRMVDRKLENVQNLLMSRVNDCNLLLQYDRLLLKREKLLQFDAAYWQQRSKSNYRFKGDTNSKFFHAHASIRRNRNLIKELVSNRGESISDPSRILAELTSEFEKRFSHDIASSFSVDEDFQLLVPIISDDDNQFLCAPVLGEEVKEAVFDLAPDKSPGPDGFPPFFFQKYWTLVGNSVIRAVQAFFHSGQLLREINHTFVALIPKIDNPSLANHFRPISLCSTIYKVISKVISNRLKVVLGRIIHPLQGAFVPERLIQDNILIAHEVFHSFNRKSGVGGWLAIKLDMEKAYDRLEWNYVLVTLEKLGFAARWISWIRSCIESVSFSILVNGIPGERFFPSRGIRQGDPLSPYLFILCAELLARQLAAANDQSDRLVGVFVGRSGIRIPFLTFADDTMIFASANDRSCFRIKEILDKYCSMSGQLVDFSKSAFQVSSNVSDDVKRNFANILQMSESEDLGSYLGCPIIQDRVTKETFASVVTRANSQLTKWKANSLSQAGRAVLIQANLATKANFQMQSFCLPKTT